MPIPNRLRSRHISFQPFRMATITYVFLGREGCDGGEDSAVARKVGVARVGRVVRMAGVAREVGVARVTIVPRMARAARVPKVASVGGC